jgi:hypothetical protein
VSIAPDIRSDLSQKSFVYQITRKYRSLGVNRVKRLFAYFSSEKEVLALLGLLA